MYLSSTFLCLLSLTLLTHGEQIEANSTTNRTTVEWTALGDSYAVGAGVGIDLGWGRCLRFSESYPELMLHAPSSDALGRRMQRVLNFPACSGATTADILAHQFDSTATFDLQYGERPRFGDPAFATLTAGGDDVDFVNLVRNCIYDILPWRSCDEQRTASRKMIDDQSLVDNLDTVIKKTLSTGRGGSGGKDFKLFVTGYAKFFNAETTQCSNVTWSILPWPFGNRQLLTQDLRRDLNDMTDRLNAAIKSAVARNAADNVYFINWDGSAMDGHRYCEAHNTEPCDTCNSTWFWEYPHTADNGPSNGPSNGREVLRDDEQTFKDHLAQLWDDSVQTFEQLTLKSAPDRLPDVPMHLHQAHKWIEGLQNLTNPGLTGATDEKGLKLPGWLIERVRVFHPRLEAHRLIERLVVEELAGSETGRWSDKVAAVAEYVRDEL